MDSRTLGLVLLGAGLVAVLLGLLVLAGLLRWFGNLPGDFSYSGRNVKVYAPIASMLLLSVVISLALALLSRLK